MGRQYHRAAALLLLGLFLMAALPIQASAAIRDLDELQRINTLDLIAGDTYVATISVQPNTSTMVTVNCQACEVMLEHSDDSASDGQRVVLFAANANELTFELSSTVDETVHFSLTTNISDTNPTIRPSPSSTAVSHEVGRCLNASMCMDTDRGTLAGIDDGNLANLHHSGTLDTEHDEYVIVNASKGDTLEWQWLESSHDLNLQMYFQDSETEHLMENVHHLTAAFTELSGDHHPLPGGLQVMMDDLLHG